MKLENRVLQFSIILVAILLSACSKKEEPKAELKYVKISTLCKDTQGNISNTYSGVVKAAYEPQLSFRVSGKIISRSVEIGQTVKKGQVLATLDPSDYKLNVDSAVANLASAKSNYITQQQNLERYRQLLKDNFVSQASFDTQQSNYDSAKAKFEQSTNELQNSKNQLSYTSLTAPGDGIVSTISMDVGKVVSPSDVVATMAFSGPKELEIQLPETQVNSYKVGQSVAIQMWSSNKTYEGKIRTINQSNDAETRTYTAKIQFVNGDDSIKYGMSASADIQSLTPAIELSIPTSSIYSIQGKSYVWRLVDNKTVKKIPVDVKHLDSVNSLVLADLKCGDVIVTAGANLLYDNQPVQVYTN